MDFTAIVIIVTWKLFASVLPLLKIIEYGI
jgi:hypothetical protein